MTTYYAGLLSTLPEQEELGEVIAFMPPDITHMRIPSSPRLELVTCSGLPSNRVGRVAYEHLRLPKVARDARADVLLSTHNVKPLRWRGPSVVVLQSMQYFFLTDQIGRLRRAYLKQAVPRSLHGADLVIAVTEAQRRDAMTLFSLDPEQIVTVHHGPSTWALEAAQDLARSGGTQRPISGAYVATVSSLYEMKNHRRLIQAFAQVVGEHDIEHDLVIVGREADVTIRQLKQVADNHGVRDRVRFTGPLPQEDLPALLAHADAIAYVSLYETFGHPVLEAFAFGRPLVTSNLAGTAEVANGAAELVDPLDVGDIARGLYAVLSDDRRRSNLAATGRRRLAEFSWSACAHGTVLALKRAIELHASRKHRGR